jgi:hypothetical protein
LRIKVFREQKSLLEGEKYAFCELFFFASGVSRAKRLLIENEREFGKLPQNQIACRLLLRSLRLGALRLAILPIKVI